MGCELSERIPLAAAQSLEIESYDSPPPDPQPARSFRMWFTARRGLSAICLCLLVLSILAAIATSTKSRFVNCKKMVFAPICRGVAAKRAVDSMHYKAQQPQMSYSMRGVNQYMPTDRQSPYWLYQSRLADRNFP